MDNRNSIITIFRTTNPAKIIVFFASSLSNEIRFYLNDTYYLTAIECEDGFVIRIGEKKKEIKQQKNFSIRKFSKKRILLFFIIIGVATLFFLESLRIANNILFFLIVAHFIIFLVKLASILGTSAIENSQRKKSKHSAEHMMVNFIENNQRLPKNI